MTKRYRLKNIRSLLIESFSETELRDLCFYEPDFNPVLNQVSETASKNVIIRQLMRYAQQQELFEMLLALAKEHNPAQYEIYQPYYDDSSTTGPEIIQPEEEIVDPTAHNGRSIVGEGFNALISLMQAPEVFSAVVAFQTDFQAACQQITLLSNYKQLHESFQGLENRYRLIDHDRKRLPEDDTAWDSLALNEPDIQGTMNDLLDIANQATFANDEAWWIRQLGQTREELRLAVEAFDLPKLKVATSRLQRVLAREPSRINTLLVAATGALRLDALVQAMSTVHKVVAPHDLGAVRQFEMSLKALADLANKLNSLVDQHNAWQAIDDELRRVEANLSYDFVELEWTWPDLKFMAQALYGDSQEPWAISLNTAGIGLEAALSAGDTAKVRQLFRRYRSQASRRFRQVDHELLDLCQELQKIGESLNLILKVIQ